MALLKSKRFSGLQWQKIKSYIIYIKKINNFSLHIHKVAKCLCKKEVPLYPDTNMFN